MSKIAEIVNEEVRKCRILAEQREKNNYPVATDDILVALGTTIKSRLCLEVETILELDEESIAISRGHMANAGCKPTFFEDGVQALVLELLEFRRRYNAGKRLDLEDPAGSYTLDLNRPVCARCQSLEEHHTLETVECEGYEEPPPLETSHRASRPTVGDMCNQEEEEEDRKEALSRLEDPNSETVPHHEVEESLG